MKKEKEFLIKIIIIILLLLLTFITSFRTGEKLFIVESIVLKNNNRDKSVARWNFNARIIRNEVVIYEIKNENK